MPNCDFYALGADLRAVIGFIFAQPAWRLVELASAPDHDLKEFSSEADFLASYPALEAQNDALHFQLYCDSMGGGIRKQRITFRPGTVPGASFRYDSCGWGLIQVYFGILRNGRLSPCHTNHNSERRAKNWEQHHHDTLGPVSAWNWAEVARMSRRLNRFVQGTSKAKEGSRPVMPSALQARASGTVAFAPT